MDFSFHLTDRKKKYLAAAGVVAVCLFFGAAYSFLDFAAPARPGSPDEAANRYFVRLFAADSRLYDYEYLNFWANGLIHPRSIRIVDDFLVPVGFIGLPIVYGGLAKATGLLAVPYFTSLLAVLAALAWGGLIGKLFGRRIGFLSAALLLSQPVWWYWSARSLMPNVPFVALLIISSYFFFAAPWQMRTRAGASSPSWINGVLAGLFLGAALAVRMSEAYWIALAVAVLLLMYRRSVPWPRLAACGAAAAAVLAPIFLINRSLYGSFLATGYAADGAAASVASLPHGLGNALLGPLRPYLFPLGFAPRTALRLFVVYGFGFHWWWSLLVLAALAFALAIGYRRVRRRALPPRSWTAFAAAAAVVTVWLILFYGSWEVQDNPAAGAITIGASYFRYWLPIFVLSTMPVAWAIVEAEKMVPQAWRRGFVAAVIVTVVAASAAQVFFSPGEGLLAMRANLIRYDREMSEVMRRTEPDAVIVADRADKLIFPERKVITPLRSEVTYAALGKLRGHAPLYYYGITLPDGDLHWLKEVKLPPLGLDIEPVETFQEETLYALVPRR